MYFFSDPCPMSPSIQRQAATAAVGDQPANDEEGNTQWTHQQLPHLSPTLGAVWRGMATVCYCHCLVRNRVIPKIPMFG